MNIKKEHQDGATAKRKYDVKKDQTPAQEEVSALGYVSVLTLLNFVRVGTVGFDSNGIAAESLDFRHCSFGILLTAMNVVNDNLLSVTSEFERNGLSNSLTGPCDETHFGLVVSSG